MTESDELFWDVAIPAFAVLLAIIWFWLVLLWVLDLFKDEIEWVLSRIPAVRRYRERCFWGSLKRGELCVKLSRTDPETGQVIERFVAIPPSPNFDPDCDDVESTLVDERVATPPEQPHGAGKEVPDVPAPPA